ncbi:hypothetical protein GobsT_10830 [Gemmata obscuriglobus]|uniref:DUF1553 domain-containing protein n=1 Tax=Gemmata obscuriglobus TaxID=114 RepID=A0A2Z3HG90_9BACT|nr:DUF1549 and DUF1553 domain-containing protein [Gemmata obscuriglobus]AWM40420.1 DUF1553 domain-containing protein [Gemmata obscuriglobus]QEG26344.1 hypothetical protein GobsT_10830 [Gemmata obscuriglobus]VTS01322.1 Uncharacterized protein OS=Solibacter usitatus (strain Ellin6076) GN=Acid_1145 PE=4 SV=1: PSCyt2: PSD1 [Gemmata obscuriglobus UQM 2246]
MRSLPRFSAAALLLIVAASAPAAEPGAEWAYKPFKRPAVPDVPAQKTAARNDIDRFLLAKLAEHKLTFAPEADRRVLIRRAYFDLIGLPPAPEEVEAFARDNSPGAYEKLVDRLMASPQYGERQALFWLDVVRFAETDGFNADAPRPNAWRYRDYVIKSFNADKPFDRFVKEQLAGDELYPDDPDALVATGFLRHYPDEYNAVNLEQRRYEVLTDITDTTSGTFLALTSGCARCHDHKYDPITQKDYFRLQAFFAGMWPTEAVLLTPGARAEYQKKLAAWEAKTAEIRAAIEAIEGPYHQKASAKQRTRFPDEYASLLDIPFESRTPIQKQLGQLIDKQVNVRGDVSKSLKPAEKERVAALKAQLSQWANEKPPEPPRAMAMTDLPTPPPTNLYKRGNWQKPGAKLDPGFIATIDDRDAAPQPTNGSVGRRAALAGWVASRENPLTARVIVNRLWQQRFGYGIVRTSSDFGVTGDRPTHPELLNWLADELVAKNWSLKHVHKLMVLSAAFRQGARGEEAGATADPDNKLLWQYPRRRLDGEALRDAMLAVSGQLNLKAGGPGVFPELPAELQKSSAGRWTPTADVSERNRRSVYVFVKRNLRYPLFTLFDAPDRNETCARRFVTTTAPQSLAMLNDALVIGFGKQLAARVTKEAGADREKFVGRAFLIAVNRPPTSEEQAAMAGYLARHKGSDEEARADLCHALLNLNEFVYVD